MTLKTMMMTMSMAAAMTAAAQGDLQSGIDKKNMNLAAFICVCCIPASG